MLQLSSNAIVKTYPRGRCSGPIPACQGCRFATWAQLKMCVVLLVRFRDHKWSRVLAARWIPCLDRISKSHIDQLEPVAGIELWYAGWAASHRTGPPMHRCSIRTTTPVRVQLRPALCPRDLLRAGTHAGGRAYICGEYGEKMERESGGRENRRERERVRESECKRNGRCS